MTNKEILKKQIIYRSNHRGTKEMDLLLGNFVKKHMEDFKLHDLHDLMNLLSIDDEIIKKWLFEKKTSNPVLMTKVSKMLINFRL